jgi:hypothetical protein
MVVGELLVRGRAAAESAKNAPTAATRFAEDSAASDKRPTEPVMR